MKTTILCILNILACLCILSCNFNDEIMDTSSSHHDDAFSGVAVKRIPFTIPYSFFPIHKATSSPKPTNGVPETPQKPWTNYLQGPRVQTKYRAWSRVELPSHRARNFTGTILKRVGLPLPRQMKPSENKKPAEQARVEESPLSEDGLPVRRVIRRLASYKASSMECQVKGKPFSKLEMLGLQMEANADVAQCLREFPTAMTYDQKQQRQDGFYAQTIPLKRRLTKNARNNVSIYTDILHLANTMLPFRVPSRQFGPISCQSAASPARPHAVVFSPSKELVSPAAVMKPPRRISDAKSPTKKSPRHKSPPVKNDGPRISDPAIKLLPSTTPRIEPSPMKSASSPPATPLSDMRRLHTHGVTPSTFPKTVLVGTAFAEMQRHSALRPNASPLRLLPADVTATPCPPSHVEQTPAKLSPVKSTSPALRTPSRPNIMEAATPRIFAGLVKLTADVPSPITSVPMLFPNSPEKVLWPSQPGSPLKPDDFDFGMRSPAFNSVTWLKNARSGARRPGCKKSSRRQSEPLSRLCFKPQSRRQTISPQKLPLQPDQAVNGSDRVLSPIKNLGPAAAPLQTASPILGLAKPRNFAQDRERKLFSLSKPAPSGIVSIDMRQNSDIFKIKATSLALSPASSPVLPKIAENCSEHQESTPNVFSPFARNRLSASSFRRSSPTVAFRPTVDDLAFGKLGIFESEPAAAKSQNMATPVARQSPLFSLGSLSSRKGPIFSPSPTVGRPFKPVVAGSSPLMATATPLQKVRFIAESPENVTAETVETQEEETIPKSPENVTAEAKEKVAEASDEEEAIPESPENASTEVGDAVTSVLQSIPESPEDATIETKTAVSVLRKDDSITDSQEDAAIEVVETDTLALHKDESTRESSENVMPEIVEAVTSALPSILESLEDETTKVIETATTVVQKDESSLESPENATIEAVETVTSVLQKTNPVPESLENATTETMENTTLVLQKEDSVPENLENATSVLQKEDSILNSSDDARIEVVETVTAQSHDYDSPGRDYMREFIRRSRPKRPSATEAGSPIGHAAKRQALGPKSPNSKSPSPNKRKLEKDVDDDELPIKKLAVSPKRMRRDGKRPSKRSAARQKISEKAPMPVIPASLLAETTEEVGEDDAEMEDGISRRSSRLRSQGRIAMSKSAIPTPIKIGRTSGPALNSAVRSEQQDLTNQTRMNTRRNKGNAEYPAQFLAKHLEEVQAEAEPEQRESSSDGDGRKSVNWSDPLAVYHQERQEREKEKTKSSKGKSLTKPKPVQKSGIAKPATRAKTTEDKERTARLAEHFGMVSNGTPAKPTRATRSRMRI